MRNAVWAHDQLLSTDLKLLSDSLRTGLDLGHWSRIFEYPWVLLNGNLQKSDVVLDAAGGDGVLQVLLAAATRVVFNIDNSHKNLYRGAKRYSKNKAFRRVIHQLGDIRSLWIVPDHFFDKVVCVSVLEHLDPPEQALAELWRVLESGGRLLVTMDVAETIRYNHTIDEERARSILKEFQLKLPQPPKNILTQTFTEIDPQPGEPTEVTIRSLCFFCDKE